MSWLDLFLQLLLAAAVYAMIQVLSRVWENRRACRVADDTAAAPENNENPLAQDKPPLSAEKLQKLPDKLSVIVKIMGSEEQLVIESSPSDRVVDVKSKIQEMVGIPVNSQRLIFCGRPLENQSDLKSCGAVDGSVMHVVSTKETPFQVFVQDFIGRKFTVDCDANDTVTDLKNKIHDSFGLPPEQQLLIFRHKQLEENQYLHYYNLEHESILHLRLRLHGGALRINIRISDGRSLTLEEEQTIGALKHKIFEETGIPVHNQMVLHHGHVLKDDSRTLDYFVAGNCTLYLNII